LYASHKIKRPPGNFFPGLFFGGKCTLFDFLPQINGLFFRFIAHLRHHKAIGHILIVRENRTDFNQLRIHQFFSRQTCRSKGNEITVSGGDFGLQCVIDIFVRISHVFGIGRNQPRFNPETHAFRCQNFNADFAADFFRTFLRHIQVAAVADSQADVASRQFINQ